MRYELTPTRQKSFYGKAIVEELSNGISVLYSYGTRIMEMKPNGEMRRIWDGWSATTGKHIASFCGLNKKGYFALPTEFGNPYYMEGDC